MTWVRLPIGFWAIETFPGEPFLAKTAWTSSTLGWCDAIMDPYEYPARTSSTGVDGDGARSWAYFSMNP